MDLFAPTHLFLLLMVILIIFDASKLGDVGGALGKGIRDFKRRSMSRKTPRPRSQDRPTEPGWKPPTRPLNAL